MFGMGFFEILLIAIIAIVALGPEKLPKAMVEVARFLKKFKSGVEDAKSTLDNELNISEMKEEANKFKAQIENAKSSVSMENMDLGVNDILNDDLNDTDQTKTIEETSENKKDKEEKPVKKQKKASKADKFKVDQDGEKK
jgi:sec-independent protein translocase protein TatB